MSYQSTLQPSKQDMIDYITEGRLDAYSHTEINLLYKIEPTSEAATYPLDFAKVFSLQPQLSDKADLQFLAYR